MVDCPRSWATVLVQLHMSQPVHALSPMLLFHALAFLVSVISWLVRSLSFISQGLISVITLLDGNLLAYFPLCTFAVYCSSLEPNKSKIKKKQVRTGQGKSEFNLFMWGSIGCVFPLLSCLLHSTLLFRVMLCSASCPLS